MKNAKDLVIGDQFTTPNSEWTIREIKKSKREVGALFFVCDVYHYETCATVSKGLRESALPEMQFAGHESEQ
tara:strand:+ start:11868 stop:12083 length:216 start_codon:yes stop_codon:yes gene_type:complete